MALARFVSKNLQQRLLVSSSSDGLLQRKIWRIEGVRRFSSTGGGGGGEEEEDHSSQGKEITVNEDKKFRLFPKRQGRKWLWRNNDPQFHPILYEIMPSGLGNALMQATENINRLFKSLNISPWSLSSGAHVKEQDNLYKLRMEMPGIAKEDVKVIVEDGILSIKGEHKEEKDGSYGSESGDGGEEDGVWSAASYGYYDTRMLLPDDAKVDEMKAELKNGVLIITIPRIEKPQKDVKEVIVN